MLIAGPLPFSPRVLPLVPILTKALVAPVKFLLLPFHFGALTAVAPCGNWRVNRVTLN